MSELKDVVPLLPQLSDEDLTVLRKALFELIGAIEVEQLNRLFQRQDAEAAATPTNFFNGDDITIPS